MSLQMVRAFNLRCDHCEKLHVKIISLFWSDKQARDSAIRNGWKCDGDGDFCPKCKARLAG